MIKVLRRLLLAFLSGGLLTAPIAGMAATAELQLKSIGAGGGVNLHYVEQGSGPPLVLIHGSLSDYTYWTDQMGPFARRYRLIAYSHQMWLQHPVEAREDAAAFLARHGGPQP
jgi:hypothetical protein